MLNISMPRSVRKGRPGFTLTELLVVIAIIAILAGLVAAGIFATIPVQQATRTRDFIHALDNVMMARWNEVIDNVKKETIPAGYISGLAGSDAFTPERARILWIKLRLMEAFPQSLDEIDNRGWPQSTSNPSTVTPGTMKINPVYNCVHFFLKDKVSPFRIKMIQDLTKARGAPTLGPMPTSPDPMMRVHDSATCLWMSLRVKGEGTELSEEAYASNLRDLDNDGLKEFIDFYGNPIFFYRFAFNNPLLGATNPVPSASGLNFHDPLDPKGTLLRTTWLAPAPSIFESGFHKIEDTEWPKSHPGVTRRTYYVRPAIISAGSDFDTMKPCYGLGVGTPYISLYFPDSLKQGIYINPYNNMSNPDETKDSLNNIYNFKD